MNTSINSFSRALCALALCFGFVFASCTEGPLGEGNTSLGLVFSDIGQFSVYGGSNFADAIPVRCVQE